MRAVGLSKEVKGADAQLKDLRRTVEYVDNNRESFTHIDHVSVTVSVSASVPPRVNTQRSLEREFEFYRATVSPQYPRCG